MRCNRCKTDQPRDQFGPAAEGWPARRECKSCNRRMAQIRKHGITAEDKTLIAETQGGCAICGHPEPSEKGWVLDHDRSCCDSDKSCPKCRRGVICQWCNSVLGNAFDRPETLRAAARYLEIVRGCSWHKPLACAPGMCSGNAASNATYLDGQNELTQIHSPLDESCSFVTPAGGHNELIFSAPVAAVGGVV